MVRPRFLSVVEHSMSAPVGQGCAERRFRKGMSGRQDIPEIRIVVSTAWVISSGQLA